MAPGASTASDTKRNVFQKIRELEDKLEVQRRHLKELEEKVGGLTLGIRWAWSHETLGTLLVCPP